jgi:hypothetical protein
VRLIRDILFVLVTAALFLTGCSSMQIMVEKSPDVDFKTYTSWDWHAGEQAKTGDPRIDLDEHMDRFIRETIAGGLRDRGYRSEPGAADLYVDYHVMIQDMVNEQLVNNYYGNSFYPEYQFRLPGFQDTYKMEWEEGALLILVFDSKTKQLVWRGLARTEVNTQGPRQEARDRIVEAVGKLFKKLPGTGVTVED